MHKPSRLKRILRILGPGFITGASDDDPSGIGTYAVAGASLGYATLWTALITFPLMAGVQLVCARVGMVSGMGLDQEPGRAKQFYGVIAVATLVGMLINFLEINPIAALF
jgi:Mn2+/Fe2+ NRAMP family transporter